jgi:sulfopyruvate decarboxylase subunit alpha
VFSGPEIADILAETGITHVVWLPDSAIGTWEPALSSSADVRLLRVCREGEAWPLAAGLILGGARPLVMMQITGFFESGDALRSVVFDLRIPVFAAVGLRSWLIDDSQDSARQFALPIVDAWGISSRLISRREDRSLWVEHYQHCRTQRQAGVVLLAEGRG